MIEANVYVPLKSKINFGTSICLYNVLAFLIGWIAVSLWNSSRCFWGRNEKNFYIFETGNLSSSTTKCDSAQ